ncbi:MAG TPA: hypothetical protein VGE34_00560 [Candidatus Saccharimonadales bacterium]
MINENWIFVGAVLNLIGSTNYCFNTIQGKTKPNRVTWSLWALAPLIAFAAMLGEGIELKLALMTFMVGFGPLLIFIVSFINKKSVWNITRFDVICGTLSLIGLVGWVFTRTGDVAILFSIVADGLALIPTLIKAWREPETESPLVFFFGAASATITLLAVKSYDFTTVGFPIYILTVCILLFLLIQFKLGKKISG